MGVLISDAFNALPSRPPLHKALEASTGQEQPSPRCFNDGTAVISTGYL